MKTVRQLKTEFRDFFGLSPLTNEWSKAQGGFWKKLNALGWQRKTRGPEECNDIDATAFLTDEEYQALVQEFHALA